MGSGREREMTKHKVWRNILPLALMGLLITGGFSCNLIGPHNPSGPDTTSSNFTFQTYTFGGNAGGCLLNDVTIVNDTDIWAVGMIYLDSADGNPDITPYNAVHWNGKAWSIPRIEFHTICGQSHMGSYPISSVYSFAPDDIWFSDAGEMVHWTGSQYENDCSIGSQISGAINRVWGTSLTNLYVVGNNGTILHYSNSNWVKLASGTTTDINDAWGVGNSPVYCAVSNSFDPNEEKRILKITNGTKVDTVSWVGREVSSVWTPDGTHLYACGDGVFENDGGGWKEMVTGASIYTNCIRGNGTDDIVVVGGGFGFIAHWNGAHWKTFTPMTDVIYTRVAMKGNLIVAVGNSATSEQAVITVGSR